MTEKLALTMVKMEPPAEQEAEWNEWYNTSHMPARHVLPGYLAVGRFEIIKGMPRGLAIEGEVKCLSLYDMANKDVVNSKETLELRDKESSLPPDSFEAITVMLPKFARGIYEELTPARGEFTPSLTKFLLMIGEEIAEHKQQEFNAWYNAEHIQRVLQIPGLITARRFELLDGNSAIHYSKDDLSGLTQQFAGTFHPILGSGGTISTYLNLYDIEDESVLENEAFLKEIVSPENTWKESGFSRSICSLYYRVHPEV